MLLSNEQAFERGKVCATCPSLRKSLWQCKECGCFMKVKIRLVDATCPLGKWEGNDV